ncbi:hypothetical protein [Bradyrhizobium sp.]|uniref:hypothetical protein n=1 Tax=Bradyrhizobium sp. TaxID=376 RepID=UPI0025B80C33|nr:hypothetical protein [Bradyrhizobium sp.]
MHTRTLIRAAVATRLAGLPTTGNSVHVGRTRILQPAQLPALLIYSHDESSDRPIAGNPASLGRDLTLAIEGRVATALPPDDLLDLIAFEVEGRMRDTTLDGLVFDTLLTRTQVEVAAEGERHIGAIRLEYRVRYNDPAEDE